MGRKKGTYEKYLDWVKAELQEQGKTTNARTVKAVAKRIDQNCGPKIAKSIDSNRVPQKRKYNYSEAQLAAQKKFAERYGKKKKVEIAPTVKRPTETEIKAVLRRSARLTGKAKPLPKDDHDL